MGSLFMRIEICASFHLLEICRYCVGSWQKTTWGIVKAVVDVIDMADECLYVVVLFSFNHLEQHSQWIELNWHIKYVEFHNKRYFWAFRMTMKFVYVNGTKDKSRVIAGQVS